MYNYAGHDPPLRDYNAAKCINGNSDVAGGRLLPSGGGSGIISLTGDCSSCYEISEGGVTVFLRDMDVGSPGDIDNESFARLTNQTPIGKSPFFAGPVHDVKHDVTVSFKKVDGSKCTPLTPR